MRRPAPLWPAWPQVVRRLRAAPRVALLCDFDGTLAPIVRHPAQSRLPPRTKKVLQRLQRLPRVEVGVVTGRSLKDVRGKVRLRGIYTIASHGLEWAGPDGRRHSKVSTRLEAHLQTLGRKLEAELRGLPGIYLERKTLSVALHYRNATPRVAREGVSRMEQAARSSPLPLRLMRGKKIVELLPPGRMNKGEAVRELVRRLAGPRKHRPLVVYLGDDTTDETVFARLRQDDVSIHVGSGENSRAEFRLASPAEVTRFLHRCTRVLA